jgi:signal transduction histidine kinase
MLHEFVVTHRDELIRRCRGKVSNRSIPPPTVAEIDHGVPLFLDQLVAALREGAGPTRAMGEHALLHGHDLLRRGFTISQVVHGYGDICQSITELAVEKAAPISTEDFRTLNACLDDAIAIAVTQYTGERDESKAAGDLSREAKRLGFLVHELRNLLGISVVAFDVLRSGRVGIAGSTGTILHRSLIAADDLIARALAEIRLKNAVQHPELLAVAAFVGELAPTAVLVADTHHVKLSVPAVEDEDAAVNADRQVLKAVVMNVLQNAFKFTRPATTVTLNVTAGPDRVLIEVHDECGGLPGTADDALFGAFEQRSGDRSGLGLGLAFCRWAVEANGGRIYARNHLGVGCVFTIDLPRSPVPAVAVI